ncbi:serine hydrolase [candidate division KSB1 bacterium]|nr:serine hydrolase [candidate division KSB1 bacterium]
MIKLLQKTTGAGLLLLFLLLIVVPTYAQEDHLNDLNDYVEKAMRDWKVPGVAISIVKDDSVVFAKGYGIRELGKEAKVDEYTLFSVASNTKAFTAALLGMLVDESKLNWDDRVTDYLREFQMYDPYVTREINIRDLLTHRSGLPTFGGDHLWIGNSLSRDEIIARIRHLKPSAQFRTKFQYQNLMFLVAGQVIPEITGKSWEVTIKERILIPLGMMESNTSIRDLKGKINVATPHEIVGGKLVPIEYDNVDNTAPAGAINSNVVEMARWMRLNLNGGVYNGKQILSAEVMREMHTIQMPIPISADREKMLGTHFLGYGLGWGISDYRGRKLVSHGGGLSGMISLQTLIPEENLGVIILTNFAPHSLTRALTYKVIDAFLGEPERDWSAEYLERRKESKEKQKKAEKELQTKRVKRTKPSLKLKNYSGIYSDELSGEAEVRLENRKLVFNYNPRHIGDLEHWHYDTFRVTWRNPIYDMPERTFLTFYLDEMGKVAKLKVTFYDPIYFKKVPRSE